MNKHPLNTTNRSTALFADRVSSSPPSPVLTGERAGVRVFRPLSPVLTSDTRLFLPSPILMGEGGGEGLLASQLSSTIVRPIATHEELRV